MRLDIWRKIGLSGGDLCFCTVLCTRSGARYYWMPDGNRWVVRWDLNWLIGCVRSRHVSRVAVADESCERGDGTETV